MSGRVAEYIPIMRFLRVHETYSNPSQAIGLGFFIAYYIYFNPAIALGFSFNERFMQVQMLDSRGEVVWQQREKKRHDISIKPQRWNALENHCSS